MAFITDPIADMLVRVKNANQRKAKSVDVPFSKIKETITKILKNEGYIVEYELIGEGVEKKISITLKYKGNQRVISGVKRISKPGLRVYTSAEDVPTVLSGYGTAIISTSQGMITDKKARELKIGGEIIAYVW